MDKICSMNPPGLMPCPEPERRLPLAMAYVPMQEWREVYDNGKALMRGTLFPELDLPFGGKTR